MVLEHEADERGKRNFFFLKMFNTQKIDACFF